jgi:hypothetical protein
VQLNQIQTKFSRLVLADERLAPTESLGKFGLTQSGPLPLLPQESQQLGLLGTVNAFSHGAPFEQPLTDIPNWNILVSWQAQNSR